MFVSAHYSGEDLVPKFNVGEAWKKVFGPVFVYCNSAFDGDDPLSLWDDAKMQVNYFRIELQAPLFFNFIKLINEQED